MLYKVRTFIKEITNKSLNIFGIKDQTVLDSISLCYQDYVIKDIVYDNKSGIYYAKCKYDNTLYSLEAFRLDLLINDLISFRKEFKHLDIIQ